jgi:hypothetical protein
MKDIFFAPIRYRRDPIKAELLSIFVYRARSGTFPSYSAAMRRIDKAASLGSARENRKPSNFNQLGSSGDKR